MVGFVEDPKSHKMMWSRIHQGMESQGFTLTSLANACGVTQQSISQMKMGHHPGRKHWPTIAKVLGCSVEWLVGGTGEPPTWASVMARGGVKIAGEAVIGVVMKPIPKLAESTAPYASESPANFQSEVLGRLDRIERLLLSRFSAANGDELIRAGLAVPEPYEREASDVQPGVK